MLNLQMMKKFVADEAGATAIEYGLIAALVSIAIVTAVTKLGTSLDAGFNQVTVGLE